MGYDPYAKFRTATGCGHMTGTVGSGPSICGKPAKYTVEANCSFVVNGLACGIHARRVQREGYTTNPIKES